jgi:hypothetical protein
LSLRLFWERAQSRRTAANFLSRDDARRVAANIAKLPELLTRQHVPDDAQCGWL